MDTFEDLKSGLIFCKGCHFIVVVSVCENIQVHGWAGNIFWEMGMPTLSYQPSEGWRQQDIWRITVWGRKNRKPGVGISVRQMSRKGLDLGENTQDVKAATLRGFNNKAADLSRVHFRKQAGTDGTKPHLNIGESEVWWLDSGPNLQPWII